MPKRVEVEKKLGDHKAFSLELEKVDREIVKMLKTGNYPKEDEVEYKLTQQLMEEEKDIIYEGEDVGQLKRDLDYLRELLHPELDLMYIESYNHFRRRYKTVELKLKDYMTK